MSSGASDSSYEYEVEKLLQQPVTRTGQLGGDGEQSFYRAYAVLSNNFIDILDFLGDDVETNPEIVSVSREDEITSDQSQIIQLIHNYLAALYSWNENIKCLVNRHTPAHVDFESEHLYSTSDNLRSQYSKKVTFLHGLRVDCQHGGFESLVFEDININDNEVKYHLKFDDAAFMQNDELIEPARFLHHTRQPRREYPIAFLARFHQNEFQYFYNDMQDWFDL